MRKYDQTTSLRLEPATIQRLRELALTESGLRGERIGWADLARGVLQAGIQAGERAHRRPRRPPPPPSPTRPA
ncbi:MAG: hypothetical protein U0871_10890 [Gemmataceae bacterium]